MTKCSFLEIVMVSMNNLDDFRRSIVSIQGLLPTQYRVIVVDSSGTSDVLEESNKLHDSGKNILYKWEEPQGIYHAMNTGVTLCKDNSLILFLNPGDLITDSTLIFELVELIDQGNSKWGYGLASYDNDSVTSPTLFPIPTENTIQSLFNGDLQISHQSMLVRKEVLVELGMFKAEYRIAADLDFQFKLIANYLPAILPKHLITVDSTGISHNQQIRTLVESFLIRFKRTEFSIVQKISWLLRNLVRRVKASKRLRLRNVN